MGARLGWRCAEWRYATVLLSRITSFTGTGNGYVSNERKGSRDRLGGQQTLASHLLRRHTWYINVLRNSVIVKIYCISEPTIAVWNTALVRIVCWLSCRPSKRSQEALWSYIEPSFHSFRTWRIRPPKQSHRISHSKSTKHWPILSRRLRMLRSNLWKRTPDNNITTKYFQSLGTLLHRRCTAK